MGERDYYECEPILIEYIRQNIPDFKEVAGYTKMFDALQNNVSTPSAYVYLASDEPFEQADRGNIQKQEWAITLVVREIATQKSQADSKVTGGKLVSKIIDLIRGYSPSLPYDEFKFVKTEWEYYGEGMAGFAVIFETKMEI